MLIKTPDLVKMATFFQVPDMVRSIPESRTFILRQQTQILWDQYFSSIEKIVFTTFEVRQFSSKISAEKSIF